MYQSERWAAQMKRVRIVPSAAMALLLSACGITGNLRGHPGFAAFERPGIRNANRELALSLGPLPLRIGRLIARPILADDPEMLEIAKDLQGVRVYVYALTANEAVIRQRLAGTQSKLVDDGWEPVVAVREDGGWVSALVRLEPRQPNTADTVDSMRGLVVMVLDSDEVVLINLIGRFEPSTFGALMDYFEIETPAIEISPS